MPDTIRHPVSNARTALRLTGMTTTKTGMDAGLIAAAGCQLLPVFELKVVAAGRLGTLEPLPRQFDQRGHIPRFRREFRRPHADGHPGRVPFAGENMIPDPFHDALRNANALVHPGFRQQENEFSAFVSENGIRQPQIALQQPRQMGQHQVAGMPAASISLADRAS